MFRNVYDRQREIEAYSSFYLAMETRGITYSVKSLGKNIDDDDWQHYSWIAVFKKGNKSTSFSYRTGLAHVYTQNKEAIPPTAHEVFLSLYEETKSVEEYSDGFEDWARDYGYDPDSRKAYKLYEAVKENAIKLHGVFGDIELFRKALADSERENNPSNNPAGDEATLAYRRWKVDLDNGDRVFVYAVIEWLKGNKTPYFALTQHTVTLEGLDGGGGTGIDDEVRQQLPEKVQRLERWHLAGPDGPMHYIANSKYWLSQGNFENFKESCVFGAVEDDEIFNPQMFYENNTEAQLEELLDTFIEPWLVKRLPRLLEVLKADLEEVFGEETEYFWRSK